MMFVGGYVGCSRTEVVVVVTVVTGGVEVAVMAAWTTGGRTSGGIVAAIEIGAVRTLDVTGGSEVVTIDSILGRLAGRSASGSLKLTPPRLSNST